MLVVVVVVVVVVVLVVLVEMDAVMSSCVRGEELARVCFLVWGWKTGYHMPLNMAVAFLPSFACTSTRLERVYSSGGFSCLAGPFHFSFFSLANRCLFANFSAPRDDF